MDTITATQGNPADGNITWCNCQSIPGSRRYPGPWHERGGEPHYPCSQPNQPEPPVMGLRG